MYMRPLFGWAAVMLVAVSPGCDRRPPPPADAVALVGGRPITRADLDQQLQRLPPDLRSRHAQHRHELLESVVSAELLALEAERLGFHRDPEYRQDIRQAVIKHLLDDTPLLMEEARSRRMKTLLAETRARFKVEILEPQLSTKVRASAVATAGPTSSSR
jgi:hypothetical protein